MMALASVLKKFSIVIIAVLALILTRIGIGYLILLVTIGIVTPILTGKKKDAIFTGILYSTLSYIISYPAGLYLINYMPNIEIPVTVTSTEIAFNLFMGWIIPVMVSIIICGITSFIGIWAANLIHKKTDQKDAEGYYFEEDEEIYPEDYAEPNRNNKKDLLSLTSSQKAKRRKQNDDEVIW